MESFGASATYLIREFLQREGLCDRQRAGQLASKLERELSHEDRLENEDGTSFVQVESRFSRRGPRSGGSQLAFGAVAPFR